MSYNYLPPWGDRNFFPQRSAVPEEEDIIRYQFEFAELPDEEIVATIAEFRMSSLVSWGLTHQEAAIIAAYERETERRELQHAICQRIEEIRAFNEAHERKEFNDDDFPI